MQMPLLNGTGAHNALKFALKVRRSPLQYRDDSEAFDYAETLAVPIQRFADVLEKELIHAKEIRQCLLL